MNVNVAPNPPAVPPNAPAVYTVREAMTECGVDDVDLFDGRTQAERLATDLFSDDFHTCMDKTHAELDSDFKTYSDLTQVQGQIRVTPGVKKNIKAFVQWARDEYRLGRDPEYGMFNQADTLTLMRRYKTHKQFIDKSSDLSDAAKPIKFSTNIKWADWSPTFVNYLRTIPGRDGVPLSYVIRDSVQPDPTPQEDFMDEYVLMAPVERGEAYGIDAAEVHTLLVKFIMGNETAEMKIKEHELLRNGRTDWTALKEHYEGVGVYAFDVTEADAILADLFYSGEKFPHMYWEKFEQRLTHAFIIYQKAEETNYTQNMKLRILLSKIKADFLVHAKAGINIELTRTPMTMTYERALATFRNEVNRRNPPQMSQASSGRERRSLREMNSHGGRGRGRGRGRGGHGGRGRGNWVHKTRSDSSIITLTDGQKIEYHPSFSFPSHVFQKMKQSDKDRLKRERAEYKKRKASEISTAPSMPVTQVQADHLTQVSQLSQDATRQNNQDNASSGSTIMGGRNERANNRN